MAWEIELLNSLQGILGENLRGRSDIAVSFSGGLDSSILAAIASEYCTPHLYTVGIEDSHDISVARITSEKLGLPWEKIVLTEEDIINAVPRLAAIISDLNPLVLSYELPLYFVALNAKESLLINGQGADELFGGYKKYELLSFDERVKSMDEDLKKLLDKGMNLERKIAAHFGKAILHPFLNPQFIDLARSIPVEERMRGGIRKGLLRNVARALALNEIADYEKKAAQYGSGIMRVLKNAARKRKLHLNEYVQQLVTLGDR
ncbi:MAG: asparagine synthase-related protein [Methanomassiliicoccales archaeon]|jgi:asparagine synthase (glutamine-hydrolysing)|nr:asparagine synthase-related protein [Methanomassiliicoccales archaeon]